MQAKQSKVVEREARGRESEARSVDTNTPYLLILTYSSPLTNPVSVGFVVVSLL